MSPSASLSPARQLLLELQWIDEPTLDNFEPGANAMALQALRALLAGEAAAAAGRALYLWGGAASGKTHLLRAACAAVQGQGHAAWLLGPHIPPSHWPSLDQVAQASRLALLAVDDVQDFNDWQQDWLFGLYNAARQLGCGFLAAGDRAPAELALREDLRTRMAWGLGLRLQPLDDAAKQRVLARIAAAHGLQLRDELSRYILDHHARDMASLVELLRRLDTYALRHGRAASIPLLKSMLNETAADSGALPRPCPAQP
ncbi:DnaA regulatory inactivator Hda [Thiomonas sp. FB-6]|uniref:DnaA regulatory inactivator Hda n=1 Tax=Thiomonas sp. FB-6 TaxID=1158291 RepID=UPI000376D6B4|nr:DnaA regulatory inactivator Hda [Thiomonas sp. FB-6]